MSNEDFDNQENLNVGFRDIFINSAVACLLLFFIFSIRSGLFDFGITSQNTVSGKGQRNYAFEAEYAKIVEKSELEGSYQSIIGVELVKTKGEFTQKTIDKLIIEDGIEWENNENFDEYYFFNPSNNSLTLYLVLGATSKDKIKLKFNNHEVLKEFISIKGFMIDGASSIRSNKVKSFMSDGWDRELLSGREIVFKAVKLKEDQTIDINKAIRLR